MVLPTLTIELLIKV